MRPDRLYSLSDTGGLGLYTRHHGDDDDVAARIPEARPTSTARGVQRLAYYSWIIRASPTFIASHRDTSLQLDESPFTWPRSILGGGDFPTSRWGSRRTSGLWSNSTVSPRCSHRRDAQAPVSCLVRR